MAPSNLYKNQEAIYDFLRELFFSTWQMDDLGSIVAKATLLPHELQQTNFVQCIKALDESTLKEERHNFNQLFMGPSKPLCPPFESYYNEKKILNQNSSIEAYYEKIGLHVKQRDFLSDFIGIYCEFLYCIFFMLCDTNQNQKDEYEATLLQIKDDFIDEHMKNWISLFTEDIEQKATSTFWKSFAPFLHKSLML